MAEGAAVYESWAPAGARWSLWVKPVLFAHMDRVAWQEAALPAVQPLEYTWVPPADSGAGLIVELPGVEAVLAGLALADRGYRPVPLFNTTPGPKAVLPADAIMRILGEGAGRLSAANLAEDAPPAFLLDAERLRPGRKPAVGDYDNRWVIFPQDFPSVECLRAAGLREVVVVRRGGGAVADDLADVLVRWQRGGLAVLEADVGGGGAPQPMSVKRIRVWRWLRALALLAIGLRANSAGGFGGVVPQASSG